MLLAWSLYCFHFPCADGFAFAALLCKIESEAMNDNAWLRATSDTSARGHTSLSDVPEPKFYFDHLENIFLNYDPSS